MVGRKVDSDILPDRLLVLEGARDTRPRYWSCSHGSFLEFLRLLLVAPPTHFSINTIWQPPGTGFSSNLDRHKSSSLPSNLFSSFLLFVVIRGPNRPPSSLFSAVSAP